MKFNLHFFVMISVLLVHDTNLFAQPSSVLYDEIGMDGTVYYRQGRFLTPRVSGAEFCKEDKLLIEKIINLYQVSHNTLVDFTCPDSKVACVRYGLTTEGVKFPLIALSLHWQKLPLQQKKFILAHELAHYVLGHCESTDEGYLINVSKKHGDAVQTCGIFGFTLASFAALEGLRDYIEKRKALFFHITGSMIGTCLSVIASVGLRSSQTREQEADIKAAVMLGNAQGGIAWLSADLSGEAQYGIRFIADTLGISTHPSHHARIRYLQEWQAQQVK